MNSNKYLIGLTGSTGVLGCAIRNNWTNLNENFQFICFKGDIENNDQIQNWLRSNERLDGIIHLAAIVPTIDVDKDPLKAFRVNTLGTLNLLENCRLVYSNENCPWIFITSSSHVYQSSTEKEEFVTELSAINPVSTYGLTKAQADQWAQIYQKKYSLPICIGRIFSYTHPKQKSSFFIPSLIQKIKDSPLNSTLEMRGLDGTRDFLTVKQITQTILFLFEKKSIGIYNIGTGVSIKLYDIAQAVRNKLNRSDLTIVSTGTDTQHLSANVDKLKNLGFHISFDFNVLLDSFFNE